MSTREYCNAGEGNSRSLPKRSELHSTAYTAPHEVVTIEPFEPGQLVAPVGFAAGALDDLEEVLDDAAKTLAGVHAHWYAVLETVVVTVTVEGPGAGAAEVTGAELAAAEEKEGEIEEEMRDEVTIDEEAAADEETAVDEDATADEEAGTVEEAGAAEVEMLRTSLPPIMLLFEPALLAALFR